MFPSINNSNNNNNNHSLPSSSHQQQRRRTSSTTSSTAAHQQQQQQQYQNRNSHLYKPDPFCPDSQRLVRLATPKTALRNQTHQNNNGNNDSHHFDRHFQPPHLFSSWEKTTEPLWERKSPRFFNAQKQVRPNPYPALYRGSTTTGAPAPLSKGDETKIRPPSVVTPRRAVKTLLTTSTTSTTSTSQKEPVVVATSSKKNAEIEEERFEAMIRQRAAGVSNDKNNYNRGGESPASNASASSGSPNTTISVSSSTMNTNSFMPNHNSNENNNNNTAKKNRRKSRQYLDETDEYDDDKAIQEEEAEYYSHRRNYHQNNKNNHNANDASIQPLLDAISKHQQLNSKGGAAASLDLTNGSLGITNETSMMIDARQAESDSKHQQQQQINRRAFELLRRLFILQVSERSVTRSFLQQLPSNEVIDRIEHVLKKVGASRFMSLDDFHLVLNQALCPQSGAANSALPSANDVLGGLVSPKSTMRNKQKRTTSFTEKQMNNNITNMESSLMLQQTFNTLNMTAGQNYRMTAPGGQGNQPKPVSLGFVASIHDDSVGTLGGDDDDETVVDPTGKRKRRPTLSSAMLQQQQQQQQQQKYTKQQQQMLKFSDKPPEEEDIAHITTTESRVLFSLFESNGLVSIQQIKEGLDLLLKGETYALLAYTRKIVCEPDASEKESTVTVLELEWMLQAVCTHFKNDEELKERSKKLIESLWREAHQGSVARRTFRLAILDDPLLHRAVQILPRFGSNDNFALRPETRAPLTVDPMQMMNMTHDIMAANHANHGGGYGGGGVDPLATSLNNNTHYASTTLSFGNNNKNTTLPTSTTNVDGASTTTTTARSSRKAGGADGTGDAGGDDSSGTPTGRGLAFETLDLYDPHFKGDQFLSRDPTKRREENTKEAGDPQFFSLRGQPYVSVYGGPPQPIFDVRS